MALIVDLDTAAQQDALAERETDLFARGHYIRFVRVRMQAPGFLADVRLFRDSERPCFQEVDEIIQMRGSAVVCVVLESQESGVYF